MRYKIAFILIVVMVAPLAGRLAYGHHSFAATYYVDQSVKIEGTVSQFLYRNPHSFLKVDVTDDKGQMETWAIEWGGGAQLSQANINRDTLKVGDHVIVTGNPGRDAAEHRIRMHSIVRPSDGWKWEGTVQ